jgi:hypothetical protein
MSMFQVSGTVLHCFDSPAQVNKETGEITRAEKPKVQILGDLPLANGQARFDVITLSCEDKSDFESLKGRRISVPLGMFSPAKGEIIYFIPKGARPTVEHAGAAQP